MNQSRNEHRTVSRLLGAIALMLGVLIADRWADRLSQGPVAGEAAALAQGPDESEGGGRVSAAEQRKDMIAELRAMNRRLDKIDAALSKPLPVKVLEMPREQEKK